MSTQHEEGAVDIPGADLSRIKRTGLAVDIEAGGYRLSIHPNVHAVLGLSSLILVLYLTAAVLGHHASWVVIVEILHFMGWAWQEIPEMIELATAE